MAHDDYPNVWRQWRMEYESYQEEWVERWPTPAYSPLGWVLLGMGLFYAVLVRVGAAVYALVGRGKASPDTQETTRFLWDFFDEVECEECGAWAAKRDIVYECPVCGWQSEEFGGRWDK